MTTVSARAGGGSMTWSLTARLRLGFAVALFQVALVCGAAWWLALDYRSDIRIAYGTHLRTAVQLAEAESALWQLRYGFPQFMIGGPEDRQRILGEQDQWYAVVEERLAAYAGTVTNAEGRRALTDLRAAYQRYKQARPKFFELWQAGEKDEATAWLALTTTPFGAETVRAFETQIELQRTHGARQETEAEDDARAALGLVTAITIALLALLVAGYVYAARMLSPIRALRDEALALVRERLGEDVPAGAAGNEIAALESAVRLMSGRLLAHAEALRQSRERLDYLLHTTPAVIYSARAQGDFAATFVSANVRTQLGYEPEEFTADPGFWASHVHPEDRERIFGGLALLHEGGSHVHEYRFRHKDGSWRWMHDELVLVRDSSGAPSELVGSWIDITARAIAEEGLHRAQERLNLALAGGRLAVWDADVASGTVWLSEQWAEVLGEAPRETRTTVEALVALAHPEDRQRLLQASVAVMKGERPEYVEEHRVRTVAGEWRWIQSRGCVSERAADGRAARMSGTNLDITARKTLEDALQASEARLRHLLNASPAVIYSAKAHGDYGATFVSANVRAQQGHAPEDFLKNSGFWANNIHPDERERVLAQRALLFTEGCITGEYRFRHRDGSWRWMHDETRLVRDEAGGPEELVGSWIDITARKQAEDALQDSEARLRLLLTSSPAVIWSSRAEGDYARTFVGDNVRAQLGHDAADFLGDPKFWLAHVHPDDVPALLASLPAQIERGHIAHEYRFRHGDGTWRWIHAEATVLRDANGRPQNIVGYWIDVSERRQARDAIESASRMKSEFMASVTHELRTPLNSVIGFSELLHEEVPGPLNARQAEFVADILASGERLLVLVEGILEMSRLEADAALAREPVDIAAALAERIAAQRPAAAARGLTMTLDVAADAGSAQLDPRALCRMLDALLDNAIKFNRDGGSVAVRARRHDGRLEIAVADTGIGIAGTDLAKLFQPLVQLDAGLDRRHGGIGLGLALARRLAELHGGSVEVDSEPGKGSTFTLYLPIGEKS